MMRLRMTIAACAAFALSCGVAEAAKSKSYRVGAASVVITPKVAADAPPVWLAGYGMGRQAEKVHDDVYARAMVIHDGKFGLAIVTCDLVGFFYDDVLQVREAVDKLGLEPKIDHVLVSSTHTHAGPDTIGIWGPVGRTGLIPGYLARVRAACVEAVQTAHRKAKRATLRIATIDANAQATLIGDSRLPKVIDSNITVIQAKPKRGPAIVTLVNMPCHPEVLGSRNPQLSSDFPSTMREYLEKKYGGVAIYSTGTIGGLLSPRTPKADPFTREALPGDEIGRMMAYGRIIGRIVEHALKDAAPLTGPISVETKEVLLPVWNQLYELAMRMGVFSRQVYHTDGKPVVVPKATRPSSGPAFPRVEDPHLKTEVGLIQIGPLQIAAIPGEIYPELTLGKFQRPQEENADFPGAPLEPTIYPLMTGRYKMVIGLANDEVGYILPKSQWDWYAPYAYGREKRQYGEANSCSPEVGPRLMAAWAALIKGK